MVALDELKPYVQPHANGMSEPAIERLIIDSTKEFADRTGAARESISLAVAAGQVELNPEPASADEEVAGIISVEVGDSTATFANFFGKINLSNAVSEDSSATIECWTRPKYGVTQINDVFANHYREGIVSGAIYRAKMTPGESYDPQGANTYFQLFEKAVSQAKYDMASQKSVKTITKNPQRLV